MDSSTEIEAKFDASPKWKLPDFAHLVARKVPRTELVAVYWDTEDRRLVDRGVTLRHRITDGGARTEWTLKLPLRGSADGVQRRREVNVQGPGATPPAELTALVTAMSRGASLQPVAELRTDRRRRHAGNDLWSHAVEITDDRVTSRVAGRTGPAFRQIEVELLDHDAHEVMASVIDTLRAAGLERSADDSKLQRVLGTGTRCDHAQRWKRSSLGFVTSRSIGRHLSEIVRADPWLRLGDDVDAVHACRKGVRRLRSDLKTLRPVLARRRTEPLRDELKWLNDLLGEVRDLHVLRQQVRELSDELAIAPEDRDAIVAVLESQLEVERRNLLSAMGSDRYLSLISALTEFEQRVPLRSSVDPNGPAREVLAKAGRKSWKKAAKAHRRVGDHPSSVRLHTLRKKVKDARATAQLAKEAGSSTKKFVRAAGRLKDELGDLHDADVLVEWLDELPGRLEPAAAYSAGRLRQHAVQERAELAAAWPATWDDLDRKRRRRWMR